MTLTARSVSAQNTTRIHSTSKKAPGTTHPPRPENPETAHENQQWSLPRAGQRSTDSVRARYMSTPSLNSRPGKRRISTYESKFM